MKKAVGAILAGTVAGLVVLPFDTAHAAKTGFYVGGSVGQGSIELDGDVDFDIPDFDEDDFAWKVFGGYNFGLGPIDVGVEGGYVDLGAPSDSFTIDSVPVEVGVDLTGFNAWGIAALDLGLIDVFGKLGVVAWDLEGSASIGDVGSISGDDSGTDLGYGIGARFNIGGISIRGEWERYDIDDVEQVDMLSVGLSFNF